MGTREDASSQVGHLAEDLLSLVRQPVLARGREISRERWESKVLDILVAAYRLGADQARGSALTVGRLEWILAQSDVRRAIFAVADDGGAALAEAIIATNAALPGQIR